MQSLAKLFTAFLNWELFPLLRICGEIYWSTERGWKTKRWRRATFWWVLTKCSPWHDITHCRVFSCWASRRSGRWRWAGLRRRSPTWTGACFQPLIPFLMLCSEHQGGQHPPGRHLHPHYASAGKWIRSVRHSWHLWLVAGQARCCRLPGCHGGCQQCNVSWLNHHCHLFQVLVTLRYPCNPGALIVQGDALYHTGLFEHSLVSYYKVVLVNN